MISRIDRVIDVTRKHTELFLELLNVAYLTNNFLVFIRINMIPLYIWAQILQELLSTACS